VTDAAGTTFFDSRWITPPEQVREVSGLPAGFRAAGVAAQIKPSGAPDVALIVCDAPDATSAARFSRSGVLAPPVLLAKDDTDLAGLRAIAANAGNANCATGEQGLQVARAMREAAADALGVDPRQVLVASTGVIGVQLDEGKVTAGLRAAAAELSPDGDIAAGRAIMTTDAFPKQATIEVELSGGPVRIAAQAKGAGMISPAFATMFCFVETDAALSAEEADLLLSVCVKRSFDRVSVDGQLSTNDTAALIASGASGVRVEPQTDDERRFGEALDALLRQLALLIVRDGEGATRVGRVIVRGGHEAHVEGVARAVANSPLVKSALTGGDPNWGRIVQSVGMALPGTAPLPVDVWIEDVQVCAAGVALPFDEPALAKAVAGREVQYEIGLPGDGAETEVFFSDLTHEYVSINSEYTT
jgi:glutamate N-acetyltransferase/amino-acid N-acetyltransferase